MFLGRMREYKRVDATSQQLVLEIRGSRLLMMLLQHNCYAGIAVTGLFVCFRDRHEMNDLGHTSGFRC